MRDDPYSVKWGKPSVKAAGDDTTTASPRGTVKDTPPRREPHRLELNSLVAAVHTFDRAVIAGSSGQKRFTIDVPQDLHTLLNDLKGRYGVPASSLLRVGALLLAAVVMNEDDYPEQLGEYMKFLKKELEKSLGEQTGGEG